MVGRIEVKTHDVAYLLHEEGVGGEFETLGALRLESEELEVAAHRALGNPGCFGDQAHTPVGGALGFGVQDAIDQRRHLLIAMGPRATGPQLIVQAGQPLGAIPGYFSPCRRVGAPRTGRAVLATQASPTPLTAKGVTQ